MTRSMALTTPSLLMSAAQRTAELTGILTIMRRSNARSSASTLQEEQSDRSRSTEATLDTNATLQQGHAECNAAGRKARRHPALPTEGWKQSNRGQSAMEDAQEPLGKRHECHEAKSATSRTSNNRKQENRLTLHGVAELPAVKMCIP